MNSRNRILKYLHLNLRQNKNERIILDENRCKLLNGDEICPVANNDGVIFFFGKKQFIETFSELFRAESHVFRPYSGNCEESEMIVFKNGEYTYVFDKLKEREVPIVFKGNGNLPPVNATILAHPFTRYCTAINNLTGEKGEIDTLPIVKEYAQSVLICELLSRANDAFKAKWEKLNGDKTFGKKKVDYVS
jgi:hypothetical protein